MKNIGFVQRSILLGGAAYLAIISGLVLGSSRTYQINDHSATFDGLFWLLTWPGYLVQMVFMYFSPEGIGMSIAFGAPIFYPIIIFFFWIFVFIWLNRGLKKFVPNDLILQTFFIPVFVISITLPLLFFYTDNFYENLMFSDDNTQNSNPLMEASITYPLFIGDKLNSTNNVQAVIDYCMNVSDTELITNLSTFESFIPSDFSKQEYCMYHLGIEITPILQRGREYLLSSDPDTLFPQNYDYQYHLYNTRPPDGHMMAASKIAVCKDYGEISGSIEKQQRCLTTHVQRGIKPSLYHAKLCELIQNKTSECDFMDSITAQEKEKYL